MNKNKPYTNTNLTKRHNLIPKFTTTLIKKNLNHLGMKTTTRTTRTLKQAVMINFKNSDSHSNAGVLTFRILPYMPLFMTK